MKQSNEVGKIVTIDSFKEHSYAYETQGESCYVIKIEKAFELAEKMYVQRLQQAGEGLPSDEQCIGASKQVYSHEPSQQGNMLGFVAGVKWFKEFALPIIAKLKEKIVTLETLNRVNTEDLIQLKQENEKYHNVVQQLQKQLSMLASFKSAIKEGGFSLEKEKEIINGLCEIYNTSDKEEISIQDIMSRCFNWLQHNYSSKSLQPKEVSGKIEPTCIDGCIHFDVDDENYPCNKCKFSNQKSNVSMYECNQ